MWTHPRAKYCFACGCQLRDRCGNCNEAIMSLKFRFCPFCGKAYKGDRMVGKESQDDDFMTSSGF